MNDSLTPVKLKLIDQVVLVVDGGTHMDKPQRNHDGSGYYAKLTKFDPVNDRFQIGHEQWIPAAHVADLREYYAHRPTDTAHTGTPPGAS